MDTEKNLDHLGFEQDIDENKEITKVEAFLMFLSSSVIIGGVFTIFFSLFKVALELNNIDLF